MKWLLNAHPHSLNIEATTYDGCSALKLAAGRDYGEIMNELLRCGADANTMLSDDSSSSESEEEQVIKFYRKKVFPHTRGSLVFPSGT